MDHCYYCPSFLRRHYHHIDRLEENETITPEQWNRTSPLVRAHARSIGTFAYLGEYASPSMNGFELPRRRTTQQNSEVASANLEALCLLCRLTPGHTRYRYIGDPRSALQIYFCFEDRRHFFGPLVLTRDSWAINVYPCSHRDMGSE